MSRTGGSCSPIFLSETTLNWVGYRRGKGKRARRILIRCWIFFRNCGKPERPDSGDAFFGGEQQMVAIGRGLMSEPKVLILDEPSLPLSPLLAEQMFESTGEINETGLAILLVEQNVIQSLAIADRAYVIKEGAVSISGKAEELRENNDLKKSYLGPMPSDRCASNGP